MIRTHTRAPSHPAGRSLAPLLAAATLALVIAGCAAKAPPPPPPPPPPKVVEVIPPRPRPPLNAPAGLTYPGLAADGLRPSVNRNITPAQTTWNLRSAWNVAALNCNAPRHAEINPAYRAFLKTHAKALTATNKAIDAEFRKTYGSGFVLPREKYMTSVYNHFALPPTLPAFCDAVMAMSRDAALVKPGQLDPFAQRALPSIEIVFDDFYRKYDQYLAEAAAWDARYGRTAARPEG